MEAMFIKFLGAEGNMRVQSRAARSAEALVDLEDLSRVSTPIPCFPLLDFTPISDSSEDEAFLTPMSVALEESSAEASGESSADGSGEASGDDYLNDAVIIEAEGFANFVDLGNF